MKDSIDNFLRLLEQYEQMDVRFLREPVSHYELKNLLFLLAAVLTAKKES